MPTLSSRACERIRSASRFLLSFGTDFSNELVNRTAVFQTVRSSDYRLAEKNRLLRSSKVSGSNIVSGVHCLVHDVNIHLLTIEFGRLINEGCHVVKQ